MKITKKQVKELLSCVSKESAVSTFLKEWFPEAFETVLKVGKWYKNQDFGHENSLACVTELYPNGKWFAGFGFNRSGNFVTDTDWGSTDWKEATESEVFEALKNEAVKRGFLSVGILFKDSIGREAKTTGKVENHNSKANFGITNADNMWFFRNGVWAEIIPTIIKEEAEKLINKKIV